MQSFFEKQNMIQGELERAIQRETWKCVEKEKSALEQEEKALSLLSPLNVLRRGYTLKEQPSSVSSCGNDSVRQNKKFRLFSRRLRKRN